MAMGDSEKLALIDQLDRVMEQKNRIVQKARDEAAIYMHAAETAVAAGLIGVFEGRTGKTTLVDGIGADFALAAVCFGAGFFGAGKKLAPHLYALGAGGLGVYTYKWGREMGLKMAQPLKNPAAALPTATSGGLSDWELQRLAAAARGM